MPVFDQPDYLEPQYRNAYTAWQSNRTPQTTSALLRTVDPEIRKGISMYAGKGNPTLNSRARRMTVKALETYDPARGAKLGTHIVNQLQGLKRVQRQQTQILKTPERVALEKNRVQAAEQELLDDLGREPSLTELADHVGLSPKRLRYLQKFTPAVAEGAFSRGGEEGEGSAPAVDLPNQRDWWVEVVYDDLNPTNQKIMEWTLGLNGQPQLSNQEIARRLRITPGAVSQRKGRIQQLLDEGMDISPF